jgi:hypothetical protein
MTAIAGIRGISAGVPAEIKSLSHKHLRAVFSIPARIHTSLWEMMKCEWMKYSPYGVGEKSDSCGNTLKGTLSRCPTTLYISAG